MYVQYSKVHRLYMYMYSTVLCSSTVKSKLCTCVRHGTRCAGQVAAVANNSFCVVGLAYKAKIGGTCGVHLRQLRHQISCRTQLVAMVSARARTLAGVRMLDGDINDFVEARSLQHEVQHVHIMSASWGPDDNGTEVDGPGELARRAFLEGTSRGALSHTAASSVLYCTVHHYTAHSLTHTRLILTLRNLRLNQKGPVDL